MWVDNELVINNGGLHLKRTKTAALSLSAGLHAIRIDYYQKDGDNGCQVKYDGPDTNNNFVVLNAFRVNPVLEGLTEEGFYFEQGEAMADLNGRVANLAREVDEVNYESTAGKFPGFDRADNFAVRWTGFLLVHMTGEYTFDITSDEGSKLFIEDHEVVGNDGVHKATTKSGTMTLLTGFHRLRMEYFEKTGDATVKLEYKGPDTNGKKIIIPKANLRKAAGTPLVVNMYAGLKEEVFHIPEDRLEADWRYDMPLINGRTPDKAGVVSFVNYAMAETKWGGYTVANNYAVRWSGSMVVTKTGKYTLFLGADDGAMLWMGDSVDALIDNSGSHPFETMSGERMMTEKVPTALRIDYFEGTKGAGCKFSYKGPETNEEEKVVPRRALLQTSPLTGLLLEGFYLGSAAPCDYSEAACQEVAEAQGLELGGHGSDFAGDYSTKGCYTYSEGKYAGNAYYGQVHGGDVYDEDELGTLKSGQARINTCAQADYAHLPKGCVEGHNIVTYTGKTIDECKAICDSKTSCKSFEFGVAYGGSGKYKPGDCLPQSSADQAGCDGAKYNLDLYIKEPYNDIKGIPTDLVDKVPDVSMVVSSVNYEESRHPWNGFDQEVNFAARFTGAIAVKTGGEYKLFLGCDDGCKLFMGATYDIGIDNGGLHAYQEKWHKTKLIEGEHKIMITYVQKDGVSELKFSWQGADTGNEKTIVGDMGGAGVFRRLAGPADMPMLSLLSRGTKKKKPLGKANATKPFQFLSREDKADYLSRDDQAKEAPAKKPQASFLARAENTLMSGVLSMLR
jgi:hypothetical protein